MSTLPDVDDVHRLFVEGGGEGGQHVNNWTSRFGIRGWRVSGDVTARNGSDFINPQLKCPYWFSKGAALLFIYSIVSRLAAIFLINSLDAVLYFPAVCAVAYNTAHFIHLNAKLILLQGGIICFPK